MSLETHLEMKPEGFARQCRAAVLEQKIASLACHLHAATYRLVAMLREFEDLGGWSGWPSPAHWLQWRCGDSLGAAFHGLAHGEARAVVQALWRERRGARAASRAVADALPGRRRHGVVPCSLAGGAGGGGAQGDPGGEGVARRAGSRGRFRGNAARAHDTVRRLGVSAETHRCHWDGARPDYGTAIEALDWMAREPGSAGIERKESGVP